MNFNKILRYGRMMLGGDIKPSIALQIPNNTFNLKKEYNHDTSKEHRFESLIGIDGQGCSGSSALTDYLAEFSCNTTYGGVEMNVNPARGGNQSFEVNFFRDPGSILDLERICYNKVNRLRENAVNEFIKYVNKCYHIGPRLLYRKENFLYHSQAFLREFTFLPYNNDTPCVKYDISIEKYRSVAKAYITNILSSIAIEKNLVLDNIISLGEPNTQILNDYFPENTKVLYSYRDPRDLYVTGRLFSEDWVPEDPNSFIEFYLRIMPHYLKGQNDKFMCVRFEEFVCDYEKESARINEFLNLSKCDHTYKFQFFDPSKSKKNIGIYKQYKDQESIQIIEEALAEYLWS